MKMRKLGEAPMIALAREQSKSKRVWLEILIFLAVFMVTSMASSIVLEIPLIVDLVKGFLATSGDFYVAFEMLQALMASPKYLLLQLFATVFVTAGAILFCTKIEKRSLASMGFVWKRGEYLRGFLIGLLLFAAAYGICMATGAVKIRFYGGNVGIILLFFLAYLLQGMSEEVLLRGYFLISLGRDAKIGWAIVISSVMFALLHILNSGVTVLALVNIALFGAVMAIYMLRRGSIWGVCAIHSAWNFVQGNVFGVQVSGTALGESVFTTELRGKSIITGGAFGMEGSIAVTIVLAAALVLLWLLPQEKKNEG